MAKRNERSIRTTKATLQTPAARARREQHLAAQSPDGNRRGQTPASAAAAMANVVSSVPSALGGSTTKDATGQTGTPGNLNVFGFLTGEDYNPDLDGFPMFANFNKMRLGDAQVNATLLMEKLPLKGATWIAKPASDDPQDKAIADFIQANLIDDHALARTWQHVLDNAMLKFDFGCAAAEIVWGLGEADGVPFATVTDLAPRLPRTFYRWVEDPKTGSLEFLQQFAPKNGQYGFWNIKNDDLCLHVRAREGNNYYGRSVLRTAYPHWWWKQQLYRIDMVGHDRFHVGIPIAALDENYKDATAPLAKIETTLKGLRSHDRAYMVQPHGVKYDVWGQRKGGGSGTSGILQSIEHHNLMIARNILQSFAAQGEQRHGSFGAAKVTSDVYFDALQGEAGEIASEITHAVVRRMCDLNFDMRGRKYPKLACIDISAVDFSQLATAMAALADKGLITPDDDLESWLRDLADAPGLPDALKGMPRKGPGTTAPPTQQGDPAPPEPGDPPPLIEGSKFTEGGRAFGRAPSDFERRVLDLHGIPDTLDAAHGRLVHELAAIRRDQLKTVAARIAQKDGRQTAAFTDIRHAHVKIPKVADAVKAIRAAQQHAFAYGQKTVRDELGRQGRRHAQELADNETAAASTKSARSALVSSARITARKQSETWLARILDEGLRIRRTGVQGQELESRIIASLDDEAESGAKRDAAGEIHEGFGIGRANSAEDLKDEIEKATYSAILDANTCEPCGDLDGEEFALDDPEYADNLPPNANCNGKDSCRCVYIYTFKSADERAAAVQDPRVEGLERQVLELRELVTALASKPAPATPAPNITVNVPPATPPAVNVSAPGVTLLSEATPPPAPAPPTTRKRIRVTKRDRDGRMEEGEVVEEPKA